MKDAQCVTAAKHHTHRHIFTFNLKQFDRMLRFGLFTEHNEVILDTRHALCHFKWHNNHVGENVTILFPILSLCLVGYRSVVIFLRSVHLCVFL